MDMTEGANSCNLLSNLLKQEDHCLSKAKLKLIEIEDCIKDCRSNVQKSTNVIKEAIHSATNQLEKLELNLCLELVEENQKQETMLMKTKEDLNLAFSNFSKCSLDAKLKMKQIDVIDQENLSILMVKKILPNIKEMIKDFHVDPIKFIPMPMTVDGPNLRNISIGYIQKYGIDVSQFKLDVTKGFVVGSDASVSIQCGKDFDFSKFDDYLSWDVECQGKTVPATSVIENDIYVINFNIEQAARHRVSFKILNQHVTGSPLHMSPVEDCHKDGCSQKRKSSSTYLTDWDKNLSEGNDISEDITSLVDDLPLFGREFGDSCSAALVQFFSTNVSCQSNSGPTSKKQSTSKTKLVDHSRTINGGTTHPLRKPKISLQMTQSMYATHYLPKDEIKTELDSSASSEEVSDNIKSEKATPAKNNNLQDSHSLNGYLGSPVASKSDERENPSEKLPQQSNGVDNPQIQKNTQTANPKGASSLRSHWNENVSLTDQKHPTQFNQLLENRLAAKVAFCVKSTNQFGFKYPIGVAELRNLQIIVADTFNHRLLQFNAEGEFIEIVNTSKVRLTHPSAIAVLPNGRFAVRDDVTLHLFSATGQFIESMTKCLGKHFGLTVDQNGHLLTVEIVDDKLSVAVINPSNMSLARRINVFQSDGVERTKASMPRFIAYRPPNDLLIVDLGKDIVFIVDLCSGRTKKKFGKSGSAEGAFNDPSGIVCDAEGYIIVGDSRNHRIQVFSPDGEFVTVLRVNRPLRRPSGLFLSPNGALFVLNYWEQSLVKYELYVSQN